MLNGCVPSAFNKLKLGESRYNVQKRKLPCTTRNLPDIAPPSRWEDLVYMYAADVVIAVPICSGHIFEGVYAYMTASVFHIWYSKHEKHDVLQSEVTH